MTLTAALDPRRKRRFLAKFDRNAKRRSSTLVALCGASKADAITIAARHAYEPLIPEVAEIGGGLFNTSLIATYEYLAYYKAMSAAGHSVEEIGGFFHDSFWAMASRVPAKFARLFYRVSRPLLAWKLRREAAASQRHNTDKGWRFDFVTSASGFGVNVTRCAVCSLYEEHDAGEIVPYLCRLDDDLSDALGMGLQRTGTKALGSDCCDFRYEAHGEPKRLRSQYSLPIVDGRNRR